MQTKDNTLAGDGLVGQWYFDIEGHEFQVTREHWMSALDDTRLLLNSLQRSFSVNAVDIKAIVKETNGEYKNYHYGNHQTSESINRVWQAISESTQVNYDFGIDVEIGCNGSIWQPEPLHVENLFTIKLQRANSIGITLSTSNFAFLPNNPIAKVHQFELWKQNAPLLARVLYEFTKGSKLKLLVNPGEFVRYGIISRNIFYLSNTAITGVEDPSWDEFHVPFELLDKEDYDLT